MAPIRLFTCDCGHKLRFDAPLCGKCYTRTPWKNRSALWTTCGLVTIIGISLLLG